MEDSKLKLTVIGGGCAGFQLLYHLSKQPTWPESAVTLLYDDDHLQRSWCYWSDEAIPLQHLVSKSWHKVHFKSSDFSKTESILPYGYHYIPGEDFFNYFKQEFLPQQSNITAVKACVDRVERGQYAFQVHANEEIWPSDQVFSNIAHADHRHTSGQLWQHFRGWFIRADSAVFDATAITLMDFSVQQGNAVRFMYVLPFTDKEALVEITVLSAEVYGQETYDDLLKTYMNDNFAGITYTIERTETGKIPMTDAPFSRFGKTGEVLIGTAAGMVKATTGYAFHRISKDSRGIATNLATSSALPWMGTKGRFKFYDRLLLSIIREKPALGKDIFSRLFFKTPYKTILKFLDEETTIWEEIRIFAALPFLIFVKQVFKLWLK